MASKDEVESSEGSQMKHFIPLESNPDVFNKLIRKLGASKRLAFQDVMSLDEPELRPLALILVFPTPEDYEARRAAEYEERGEWGCGDEDVLWFKQTIHNACGLYAILHALTNGEARDMIEPETPLDRLFKSCSALPPNERPSILETSKELEEAYELVAREGATAAPDDAEEEVYFHYVCLVRSHKNGNLYELDGDRSGPIERRDVRRSGGDLVAAGGLRVVQEYIERGGGNANFNLMALARQD